MLPALLLVATLLPASAPTERGFTADATLLVMTGVPGDVQSERAYEEQLARLLQALDTDAARPRRVFVLSDAPDRVRPPAGLSVRSGAASRQAFLDLVPELAAGSGPLVVLMWGHGGLQGAAPVFHVRGPRLTPADLAALAQRAGGAAARFVFLFKGSGAFGRALRAPGREALTSEQDVLFASDPASPEFVAGVLRAEPGLAFAAFAERLARKTGAWYADQHLARTEEPTFWAARDEPRRLLAAEPAAPPSPPPAAAAGTWPALPTIDAKLFPGVPAVVLRREVRYTLGEKPAVVEEVDEYLQVLNEEGESYGDVDVAYAPPGQRIDFLDCEVRRSDGTLQRLDPDAVHEAGTGPALPEYLPGARKTFSLPGVAPGAVLRVHYRTEWQDFPLPHAFLEVPLSREIPMAELEVEVRARNDAPIHFAFRNQPDATPAVATSPYGAAYRWRFTDRAALVDEVLAPSDRLPRLLVSTFPDWTDFGAWYARLVRLADQPTPELVAKAAELTRGLTTPRQKAEALYDFVTGLRYVAIPLGVNSHRPHAAARVLANRYGDCKDKANLFNTLLRTQGIAADLVLVPRFTDADERTPGLGFNHAISRVTLDGAPFWADTTDEFARFGLLPPGDAGRHVLVIDGKATGLTPLPLPSPEAHRIELRSVLDSDGAAARLELTASGYADYALRQAARASDGQRTTRPLLGLGFRPSAGAFELARQEHTPVPALSQAFRWTGEGRFHGVAAQHAGESLVRAPFWLPADWDLALAPRTTGLTLNQGYPLVLEQRVELRLPEGAEHLTLPPSAARRDGPLRFDIAWSAAADRTRAVLRLELPSGEIPADEAPRFQDALRALLAGVAQGPSFTVTRR
jgi:hypothetical protein